MKSYPIHENLDTSFINLAALIKYLRRRQFAGSVRVELGDYEAEIRFDENGDLTARENDRVSGRVGEGEEAMQRILIRARQPGGIIGVYRYLSENNPVFRNDEMTAENDSAAEPGQSISQPENLNAYPAGQIPAKPNSDSPLPFQLSNNVETRARAGALAPQDWQTLLDLTGELLGTIDRRLAENNLNFKTAFLKASAEIVGDYPFLHRGRGVIDYNDGKIMMTEQIGATVFINGIMEILRRVMEKLGANPNFSEIYRQTTQDVLALIRRRQSLHDRFSITAPLEKILGA